MVASFVFFLLLFVLIGGLAVLKKRQTSIDYLLAGQNVPAWMVGLSAIATTNSGYMFVGMIGFTYTTGLSSIWLMIGWLIGDFIASGFIHKKLREQTQQQNALSYAGVLSRWHGTDYRLLRIIGGFITLIFLGTYAAAQFSAGSKALYVLFGWDYTAGAIIGAIMVVLYCFAGGIRASIWTDVAQSAVMMVAMCLLVVTALAAIGGVGGFVTAMQNVSPDYANLFPKDPIFGNILGPILFVMGWMVAGFGVIGQPHIMVRFMAINKPANINQARIYYYSFYTIFYALVVCAGLLARILLPQVASFDAELALPTIAQSILPEIFVGLILAGLFAAAMSTADSQILSCTAAITRDITGGRTVSYAATRLTTLFVVAGALAIALVATESVFNLVLIAWAALACAFAPLMTVYALGGKPSQSRAITMMLSGLAVMLIWRQIGHNESIYEILPGMLAGFLPFIFSKRIVSAITRRIGIGNITDDTI